MPTNIRTLPTELQSQILANLPDDYTHTTSTPTTSTSRYSKPLLDAARVSKAWCLLVFDVIWARGYGCIYGRKKDLARERFKYSCYQWNLARSVGAQWAVAVRRYADDGRMVRCHVCGAEQTVVGEENLVDVLEAI